MHHSRASHTAKLTTLARAALSFQTGPVNDPHAQSFLPARWLPLIPMLRAGLWSWPVVRDLLGNVGGRTCFFDEQLQRAIDRGIEQVAILGAGYDSRAIRFADQPVGFFEVDHAATHAAKSDRLQTLGLSSPAVHVAVDFEKDDVAQRLQRAGFEPHRATFFLWEGVIEYLEEQTARATLRSLREIAAPEGCLAFDFQTGTPPQRSPLRARLGKVGFSLLNESVRLRLGHEPMRQLLLDEGWRLETIIGIAQLYERYLAGVLNRPPENDRCVALAAPC